jgi:dTDP-4-dehydrorhamnose reductase
MRVLIIGSNGMLGSDLLDDWQDDDIVPASSRDADIRDIAQVRKLINREKPDWIVLTAAYTDVDASERDADRAFAVNRDGTKNVAMVAQEVGAKLLYLSTDYVFDGESNRPYEPHDPIHPLNVYGASKAAGEKAVQEHGKHWVIARTSWLFGATRPSFPEKILIAADSQPELKVVADQIGSPTYTKDLAGAIRRLVRMDARGVLHIANSGSCSWFEFASEVLLKAGCNTPIRQIAGSALDRPAKRPAYSVLSPASLSAQGITLRNWQDALDPYLADLRRKGKLR